MIQLHTLLLEKVGESVDIKLIHATPVPRFEVLGVMNDGNVAPAADDRNADIVRMPLAEQIY